MMVMSIQISEKYCYDMNLSPQVPKNINFMKMLFEKTRTSNETYKAVKMNHTY